MYIANEHMYGTWVMQILATVTKRNIYLRFNHFVDVRLEMLKRRRCLKSIFFSLFVCSLWIIMASWCAEKLLTW